MSVQIEEQGTYELFLATTGTRILCLDDDQWFAWLTGRDGDYLLCSDEHHEKERTERVGRYVLARFDGEGSLRDGQHLFLQDGRTYREVLLPHGLPVPREYQVRVEPTDRTYPALELDAYLRDSTDEATSLPTMSLPIANYNELTVAEVTESLARLDASDLRQLKRFEQENKNRRTLLERFNRLLYRKA